jgi:hypothetical protein
MDIRTATLKDIPDLLNLENLCWEQNLRADFETIYNRIDKYAEGQFVVEKDGKVIGVLYTQKIKRKEELPTTNFANQGNLHDPSGRIVQLLSIAVLTKEGNGNTAAKLRKYVLKKCFESDGDICEVVENLL